MKYAEGGAYRVIISCNVLKKYLKQAKYFFLLALQSSFSPELQRSRVEVRFQPGLDSGRQGRSHFAEQLVAQLLPRGHRDQEGGQQRRDDDDDDDGDLLNDGGDGDARLKTRLSQEQEVAPETPETDVEAEAAVLSEGHRRQLQHLLLSDESPRLAVHRSEAHVHAEAHLLGRHRLHVHGHGGLVLVQQHGRLLQCHGESPC